MSEEQTSEERLDPTILPKDWWELSCHLWRYEWAASQENLGNVADSACGLGYGTALLKHTPGHTAGFDLSPEALMIARARYPDIEFHQVDMMGTSFLDFTTLVSFETLEHLADPWTFLKSLHSTVTTILCSAPVVPTKYRNPWHKHDFTPHGFGALIEYGGFRIVEEHFQSAPTRKNVYLVLKGIR